jgi:HlyD family secretion protein
MKRKSILIAVAVLAVSVVAALAIHGCGSKQVQTAYDLIKVTTGDIRVSVTATGTLQAIKTVSVGTQVSGKILKIYADFNDKVKSGELLAELDRVPLETALTKAQAALDEAKSVMTFQTSNFNRIKALYEKKLISESAFDEAKYNFERAGISLQTARINHDQARVDLGYAFIYSPIDGVVLDRAVSEGQTVAANFNTPTLFAIANDLTQMQVEASIDEADIGQVKTGQQVTFTVDAFPDESFAGEITQVRLKPVTISNVVTYTVIVKAPNPELKLMPGMTASIEIFTGEAEDVLTIPAQALQFTPDSSLIVNSDGESPPSDPPDGPGETKTSTSGQSTTGELAGAAILSMNKPDKAYSADDMTTSANAIIQLGDETHSGSEGRVWVKSGNRIAPRRIVTGLSDDVKVEVIAGLQEGETVMVASGQAAAVVPEKKTGEGQSSPFMPKPPSGKPPAGAP